MDVYPRRMPCPAFNSRCASVIWRARSPSTPSCSASNRPSAARATPTSPSPNRPSSSSCWPARTARPRSWTTSASRSRPRIRSARQRHAWPTRAWTPPCRTTTPVATPSRTRSGYKARAPNRGRSTWSRPTPPRSAPPPPAALTTADKMDCSTPDLGPIPQRVTVDAEQVRRLIGDQFPQWADLPVGPVAKSGWDNVTFHLGDGMVARLPSASEYALAVDKEQRWLPALAPRLPLPIPVPLAKGHPDADYPF